jgi:class 3 adenylate cyclase
MPLRLSLTYTFPVPPDRLWPIVADTDRLNRALGLPDVRYERLTGQQEVGRLSVRARRLPVLAFEEEPFEWVENRSYRVRRRFRSGPLDGSFEGGATLVPIEGGTELRVEAEFVPRTKTARLAFAALCRKTARDWDRFAAQIRRHLAGEVKHVYGEGIDRAAAPVRRAVAARLQETAGDVAADPLAERFFAFLGEAGDVDLERIRPFALARLWEADRYDVLRLCLRATRAGILDLFWDLICPNCRGGPERAARLEEVRSRMHCESCHIAYDANFDRFVEVTFRPAPRFRRVVSRQFCAAGPRNTPHIVAQVVVAPGEEREIEMNLAAGEYRLRTLTGAGAAALEALSVERWALGSGLNAQRLTLNASLKASGVQLDPASVPEGEVRLVVRNETGQPAQIVLETEAWDPDCATAAVVSVFQEFRDLFSSEVLAPDVQLSIETLPLLFTDLKGSTALYQQLGDAPAYALVRDHFALLREAVAAARGGIIKTIGDSVMAAFPDAAAALGCALAAQERVRQFNERQGRGLVILKMGLHQGPCIAVRGEERLDYFGSTVNLAARLHSESHGGDVVVSEAIIADPGAQPLLTGCRAEPFEAELRGIARRQRLWRLVPEA